jgi:hypothetical protein
VDTESVNSVFVDKHLLWRLSVPVCTESFAIFLQDNEADTLASELLHVPGGLNALANKLSTRAEKEKV